MMAEQQPSLQCLPLLEPAEAELRRQLLAALSGRQWRHGPLRADIPPSPPHCAPWFHCRNGGAFHLASLSGAVPLIRRRDDSFDGADAAAALDAAEPLLADVEAALGIDLDPASLTAEPRRSGLTVQLHGGPDRMLLALPPAVPLVPAPPSWCAVLVGGIPVAVRIGFKGPRLAPHDAAGLACGDLLLLAALPFDAALEAAGWQGRVLLDPQRRELRPLGNGIHLTENGMDDPTHPPGETDSEASSISGDFTVPLTIELESALVPLRNLQALRQGAVLPLEGSGTLAVLVRVSGQRLARGHLVSVGEGFGVLIDERVEG